MNTATFNLFLLMFQSYGIVQGASMAIVFNRDMLSFIPMIGLNIGVMSLIGRFVGAGDMARAKLRRDSKPCQPDDDWAHHLYASRCHYSH